MPRHIFLVFLSVGLAIAGGSGFYYFSAWQRAAQGRGWPAAEATIRSIALEERVNRDSSSTTYTYYPRFSYSYVVGGRTLQGERIWLTGNDFYNRRADAVAFMQGYEVGRRVPVFYDPAEPGEAALLIENPPWQILLFTAFGLLWIGLSVGFRYGGWTDPGPRFGKCRNCGARLPFSQYRPTRNYGPSDPAAAVSQIAAHSCPRCGQARPLNSLRNNTGLIVFLVAFIGIWAGGLYLFFTM